MSHLACRVARVHELFEAIGSKGLLRRAMYYRWNFPDANEAFMKLHFEMLAPDPLEARTRGGDCPR